MTSPWQIEPVCSMGRCGGEGYRLRGLVGEGYVVGELCGGGGSYVVGGGGAMWWGR